MGGAKLLNPIQNCAKKIVNMCYFNDFEEFS